MLPSFYIEQQKKRAQNGKTSLNVLIFSVILIAGFIYLWQMNILVSQDYKLSSYQKELKELQDQNKKLQTAIAQLQSLPKLQESTQNLNLLSVENISYLGTAKEKVAVNQISEQP